MPEVVTPKRIGGRVAATKSGSACRPLFALMLYPEQSAYPGHDLLGTEDQHDTHHDTDRQDPGYAAKPGQDACCHDRNNGNRGQDGQDVLR